MHHETALVTFFNLFTNYMKIAFLFYLWNYILFISNIYLSVYICVKNLTIGLKNLKLLDINLVNFLTLSIIIFYHAFEFNIHNNLVLY